jgi:hypothetical protein
MTNDAPFIDYALAVALIAVFVHFTAKYSWRRARERERRRYEDWRRKHP